MRIISPHLPLPTKLLTAPPPTSAVMQRERRINGKKGGHKFEVGRQGSTLVSHLKFIRGTVIS